MIYFYPLFELISCYQRTCANHVERNMQSVLARDFLTLGAAQITTERTDIISVLLTCNIIRLRKKTPKISPTTNPLTNFAFEKESSFLISKLNQSLNYTTVGWLQATLHKIYTSCLAMYQSEAHCQRNVNCFPFLGVWFFQAPSAPAGPNHKIHALPVARETPLRSSAPFAQAETAGISTSPLNSNM